VFASSAPAPAEGGRLGLWPATALVIGHTIAVGVFLTPAELIGAVASPAVTLLVWVAGGLLITAGAFCFGELASRYPKSGGLYVYLREGWGERAAFLYGWQCALVMDPGVLAAIAIGLSSYVAMLWPGAAGGERLVAVALIWTLTVVSVSGLTLSARVLSLVTALKVASFAVVIVLVLLSGAGDWGHFSPFVARRPSGIPLAEAVALATVSMFFSFGGFWEASRMAHEVRNPARNVPRALAIGVAVVTLTYVGITVAFIYLLPVERVVSAFDPAHTIGTAMLGAAGPEILAAVVVISGGTSLLALLMMAPRMYVAMGQDRLFPEALVHTGGSPRQPVRATLLLALLATGLVGVSDFRQIVTFFMPVTLLFIGCAAAALFRVRRSGDTPAFQTPGYPVVPGLFVALVGVVTVLVSYNRPLPAVTGLLIAFAGIPVHAAVRRRRPAVIAAGR
jgi:APA family basic amino acid/polyamine antiporter